jgi:hemerythrin-like domain-containing protein
MLAADLGDREAKITVEILRRLREEHRNIARVLKALEHQLAIFDHGEQPDYDVLVAAAEYFTGFPDRCHHPKEDLIFRNLKKAKRSKSLGKPSMRCCAISSGISVVTCRWRKSTSFRWHSGC